MTHYEVIRIEDNWAGQEYDHVLKTFDDEADAIKFMNEYNNAHDYESWRYCTDMRAVI